MVERCCRIASRIADRVGDEPGIALVLAPELNQVMFRFGDSDAATVATVQRVQDDAIAWIGGALWRGQWVMRLSVSSSATTEADADLTADAIVSAWRAVRESGAME